MRIVLMLWGIDDKQKFCISSFFFVSNLSLIILILKELFTLFNIIIIIMEEKLQTGILLEVSQWILSANVVYPIFHEALAENRDAFEITLVRQQVGAIFSPLCDWLQLHYKKVHH